MPSREIVTFTGKTFDFMNPRCEDICIEDIAHALALTNRYNGHTRVPYSVAEHCVRMSYMKIGEPLNNLLHDAAEAYIGDIPRPIKQGLCWFHYRTYSHRELMILEVIYLAFGLTFAHSLETKKADNIIMATEIRDLMPSSSLFEPWVLDYTPLPRKIKPWSWRTAERKYLSRFEELTQ
jgi:hypothetical protein